MEQKVVNPYSLYMQGVNPDTKAAATAATISLKTVIELFASAYANIKRLYPDVGLDDTQTRERISTEVFNAISRDKIT